MKLGLIRELRKAPPIKHNHSVEVKKNFNELFTSGFISCPLFALKFTVLDMKPGRNSQGTENNHIGGYDPGPTRGNNQAVV